jgi:hypothetical protein
MCSAISLARTGLLNVRTTTLPAASQYNQPVSCQAMPMPYSLTHLNVCGGIGRIRRCTSLQSGRSGYWQLQMMHSRIALLSRHRAPHATTNQPLTTTWPMDVSSSRLDQHSGTHLSIHTQPERERERERRVRVVHLSVRGCNIEYRIVVIADRTQPKTVSCVRNETQHTRSVNARKEYQWCASPHAIPRVYPSGVA